MPKIQEYTAGAEPSGPLITRQARDLDTGNVGDAITNLGDSLQNYGHVLHERNVQNEITDVSAKMSAAHADLSGQLDDFFSKADPKDDDNVSRFMEVHYDDAMDNISDNIKTKEAQQYFDRANGNMRGQFQVSALHNQANLAGQAASDNINQSMDNGSTQIQNDPSSRDAVQKNYEDGIDALVGHGLSQNQAEEQKAKGNTQFATAQVQGYLNMPEQGGPQIAKKLLKNGKWDDDFNSNEKWKMGREIDQAITGQQVNQERIRRQIKEAQQDHFQQTATDWLGRMQTNSLDPKEILSDKNATYEQKEHFIKGVQANIDKPPGDNNTMSDMYMRIHMADGDPQKIVDSGPILQALADKRLSLGNTQKLIKELDSKNNPEYLVEQSLKNNFLTEAKAILAPGHGGIPPNQDDLNAHQGFLSTFLPAYDKARKSGKTAVQLLDPKSPDYMGNLVQSFQRTPEQKMKSMFNQWTSPSASPAASGAATTGSVAQPTSPIKQVEPRKPGESPADYRKRTGK